MMILADCCPINQALLVGSTCIGKNHVKWGIPNQDALLVKQYDFGNLRVVADGVGSEKHSELASSAAVIAVDDTFKDIADGKLLSEDIADALCINYEKRLKETSDEPLSTTGIFCAHLMDQGLFLGQIGDGVCTGFINGERFLLTGKDSPFANVVDPLTPGCPPERWTVMRFPAINSAKLLLATDGIADDILPEKEAEFAEFLISMIEETDPDHREEKLLEVLKNWETPHSNDDKTVGLYHFEQSQES